jgi:hypothetical protein
MNNFNLKITTKPYSQREAWAFLQANGPELNLSIRNLGILWNWHRSKVERFLKFLKAETLIETKTSQGKATIITLVNKSTDEAHHSNFQDNIETLNESDIQKIKIKNQSRDSSDEAYETLIAQEIQGIQEIVETNPRQFQDTFVFEEEKKKRSKKRKEEIKEKTLLKEGKKEKDFSENANLLDNFFDKDESSKEAEEVLEEISTKLPVLKNYPENVTAEDILDWAEKNLPQSINVDWELEKFKDYHRSRPKAKLKDAVAYFRNWLRKAAEFNQQNQNLKIIQRGNYHDQFNNYCQANQRTTEFQRFLAGGARALNKHSWSGLDRQIYK